MRPPASAVPASSEAFALDSDGIADAVDTRRTELEDCYGTALLHAPDGRLSGVAAIVRDETVRWQEEQTLRRRLAALEEKGAST